MSLIRRRMLCLLAAAASLIAGGAAAQGTGAGTAGPLPARRLPRQTRHVRQRQRTHTSTSAGRSTEQPWAVT